MERRLTIQERADLKIRHKKERDGRVRDRIKAVLAYDDGYNYSEIAKILLRMMKPFIGILKITGLKRS